MNVNSCLLATVGRARLLERQEGFGQYYYGQIGAGCFASIAAAWTRRRARRTWKPWLRPRTPPATAPAGGLRVGRAHGGLKACTQRRARAGSGRSGATAAAHAACSVRHPPRPPPSPPPPNRCSPQGQRAPAPALHSQPAARAAVRRRQRQRAGRLMAWQRSATVSVLTQPHVLQE